MQAAVPNGQGAIAAILGLEDADVEAACEEAAQGEVVEAVNFNAPGQVVIAGQATAVARAIESRHRQRRAPRDDVAHERSRALLAVCSPPRNSCEFVSRRTAVAERSDIAVYGVDSKSTPVPRIFAAGWSNSWRRRCIWAATVRTMIAAGATQIFECGPGKVLTSLNRRIDKNRDLKMLALEDPEALDAALAAAKTREQRSEDAAC